MTDSLLAQTARAILNSALSAETGIVVEISCPVATITPSLRARQVLYRFKAENSDFARIQIRLSPDNPDSELWLINNSIR